MNRKYNLIIGLLIIILLLIIMFKIPTNNNLDKNFYAYYKMAKSTERDINRKKMEDNTTFEVRVYPIDENHVKIKIIKESSYWEENQNTGKSTLKEKTFDIGTYTNENVIIFFKKGMVIRRSKWIPHPELGNKYGEWSNFNHDNFGGSLY